MRILEGLSLAFTSTEACYIHRVKEFIHHVGILDVVRVVTKGPLRGQLQHTGVLQSLVGST